MSALKVLYHSKAIDEFEQLVDSGDPTKELAAAQLFNLIDLIETCCAVRDRIFGHFETVYVTTANGTTEKIDIKIILELKDIANDSNYHQDAVRRIRDLFNKPADEYRLFFAPRPLVGGVFVFEVLGVFHRSVAYKSHTISELKRRYVSK